MRLAENNYGVLFSKYYKIVKTMIRWLGAFAKVCVYIIVLLEVECKAMIAM